MCIRDRDKYIKNLNHHKPNSLLHSLSAQAPDTLNNLKQPINNPQSPAREYPIKYHRPRDGKDLTPNPEDLPFFFIFNSR